MATINGVFIGRGGARGNCRTKSASTVCPKLLNFFLLCRSARPFLFSEMQDNCAENIVSAVTFGRKFSNKFC